MCKLKELVETHTVKKNTIIERICKPLEFIEIPMFSYFRIESDGSFGNLSNAPKEFIFFYEQIFYANYPYLIHPCLLRSGCILTTVANKVSNSEHVLDHFDLFYLLIILQRIGDTMDGFLFLPKNEQNSNEVIDFFSKLDMLYKFISYFKRKAKPLIENMMSNGFNLKNAKGEDFFKLDPSLPLANKNPQIQKYLNTISPLSYREQQCLELFKQGKSAQATAAILRLSQRTVEHYIDNLKDKLGCRSKWELLEW